MKKRARVRRDDNLIIFPDLEKRLTEKGLESLQKKNFNEAVGYFEDAKEMDPENADTLIGLVLAYFEAGKLQDARSLAKDMLYKGIGDYFQMVDLYVMILIQLHEYEEVVHTVGALLEEKEIPPEKAEHFRTILQFSKKMVDNKTFDDQDDYRDKLETETKLDSFNLFAYQDPKEQMLLVAKLSTQNIRPYVEEIKSYLASESGHPFLKTMLLNVLKEQEYDREVEVTKLGVKQVVLPTEMSDIQGQEKQIELTSKLGEFLEHDDPVLFENIKSLVERHFFLMYPFDMNPSDSGAWAAAYHFTANEYHGMDTDAEQLVTQYGTSEADFLKAKEQIQLIEEISYPII
ncbi:MULTISPECIES: lipopolysaccharide assembly protein LapB [unclassified Bacillus (in: firmicutes)]|uniref:tetratricopeptide repeat protein n=1 Tax=unclassified Bacillus (in: firmicutes) TaxID=185979 RepID=UPI0008EFD535|nr:MULTISPECIES: tetratricopeptide repeat protein [unclassified Bacillus (in: firmicutes)]SFB16630.1 Tetratricopeptide repeat-containing protein [Bacillus sp. UNCCL13]SFQ77927.1 Tetratricopeptide repeat-containing protein [Bacillus sp. cl95]